MQASLPAPTPPLAPAVARQESGGRPARALPYSFDVSGRVEGDGFVLSIANRGKVGAGFVVYPAGAEDGGPWFYAVEPGKSLEDRLPIMAAGYDFTLHGPNGFLRRFRGQPSGVRIEVVSRYDPVRETLHVIARNQGAAPITVRIADAYGDRARALAVQAGTEVTDAWPIARAMHWYDRSITVDEDKTWLRRLAGHIETGRPSSSDPALNWPVA
jgi:phospholipase C